VKDRPTPDGFADEKIKRCNTLLKQMQRETTMRED